MGTRTCTESHEKVLPPQVVPRIMRPTAKMNKMTPPISRVANAVKMADHLDFLWKWVPSSSSFRRMKKRRIWDTTAICNVSRDLGTKRMQPWAIFTTYGDGNDEDISPVCLESHYVLAIVIKPR